METIEGVLLLLFTMYAMLQMGRECLSNLLRSTLCSEVFVAMQTYSLNLTMQLRQNTFQ